MDISDKHFDLYIDLGNDFEFRKIFFKKKTDDQIIVSDIHTIYLN